MDIQERGMKVEIHVSDAHIQSGRPRDHLRCPVAKAVVDAMGPAYHMGHRIEVSVTCYAVTFRWGHECQQAPLPAFMYDWITRFDQTLKGDPVTFPLELPRVFDRKRRSQRRPRRTEVSA